MKIKLKPVFAVGDRWIIFPQTDGSLQQIKVDDAEATKAKLESLSQQLQENLGSIADIMAPVILNNDQDIVDLKAGDIDADVYLIYTMGVMPTLSKLYDLDRPVITFSGAEYAPMQILYAVPSEDRKFYPNLKMALDYKEIEFEVRLLAAKKKLMNATVVLIGPQSVRRQHFPDPEQVRRKLGVEVLTLDGKDFIDVISGIDEKKVESVAREWVADAKEVLEPSFDDVKEVAREYLAMNNVLKDMNADALAISCVELYHAFKVARPCLGVVTLRDRGIPASCEGDITALLTTMMMNYLSENSVFMGNIVRIMPQSNTAMISHDLVPFKMAGLDENATSYKLRNFAGTYGVTAYADLAKGQEVTIARLSTDLEELVALKGKIVDCRDTVLSRITITVSVNDAREFFHKAPGCHQVVVYGDHLDELKGLCQLLGMKFTTV